MKKNNSSFNGKKFSVPVIGSYAIAKENIDISWQGNVNTFIPEESFNPGTIALITEIRTISSGIKTIQLLYNEKVLTLPFNLKRFFYFIKPNEILNGKNFCITGRLEYDRKFYENLICLFGATYKQNMSDKIDYLLTNGSEKTNKIIKAKQAGIKIINENSFWEILERQYV